MKLEWPMVVVIALVLASAFGCFAVDVPEAGWFLLGLGGGLLPAKGAITRRPKSGPPTAIAAVLALLFLSGCAPAVVVAGQSLQEACDVAGDELQQRYLDGELEQQEALDQVACVRATCNELIDRLAESVDEED